MPAPTPYLPPFAFIADGRHVVYYLYARLPGLDPEDGVECVYIGVTSNLRARIAAHARKWWWPTIDPGLTYLEEHATRRAAEEAERVAIHQHQPAMNRAGRLLVVG